MLTHWVASPAAAWVGWATAVTLGLAASLVWVWRLLDRQRRLESELFDERTDRRQCEQLAPGPDAWIWQTDSQHRLVRLQPPAAALRHTHAEQWLGQPVTELLRAVDGASALGAALARKVDVPGLACTWAPAPAAIPSTTSSPAASTGSAATAVPDGAAREAAASGGASAAAGIRPMRVRALAQHDRHGRFRGHLGVLHADRPAAAHRPGAAATTGPESSLPLGLVAGLANGATAPSPATTADLELAAADHASFTYTVTHDLRAPIRVIEGFTRIVKEDYGNALDRMGLDHLDRVLGAAARMNSMIDALLALSRLTQQPLARQPVNLSRLAEYIVDDLRRTHPDRQVRITIEPGLTTEGDPTLLRMALENLIGNAWKYTAKVRDAQIGFQHDPAAASTVYLVRDNGAGFDMRFADRLFGVFQRLHSASEFPGTGVGLASVQRIVRRHGGDIWAESAVGRGTTFRFTLAPAAPQGGSGDSAEGTMPMRWTAPAPPAVVARVP